MFVAIQSRIDVFELEENQPATDAETLMSEIWENMLRRDGISLKSNFFDLGGNSISAMQIMSACKQSGMQVSILDIVNLGTIRHLAELLEPKSGSEPANAPVVHGFTSDADQPTGTSGEGSQFSHAGDELAAIARLLKGGG